jgi:hypothetical protein
MLERHTLEIVSINPNIGTWESVQTQAIAERLKTGHSAPQMPKELLVATGKLMWYIAPILAVMHTKQAAIA